MNGVGLTTVGRLLGHRKREITAIYAHLDDAALRAAAAQATAVIARAMGYRAEPPPAHDETEDENAPIPVPEFPTPKVQVGPSTGEAKAATRRQRTPLWPGSGEEKSGGIAPTRDPKDKPRGYFY